MPDRHRYLTATVLCLALTACGSQDQESERSPPPVEETAFGDMVGTMDKARAVEDVTLQHKQDLDQAIQASEGGER